MSCSPSLRSPCGTWELRYTISGVENNGAGYGGQSWEYTLVRDEQVIAWWSGSSTTSPWSASSFGIARVSWDGDELVIEHCADHVEPQIDRVNPASFP